MWISAVIILRPWSGPSPWSPNRLLLKKKKTKIHVVLNWHYRWPFWKEVLRLYKINLPFSDVQVFGGEKVQCKWSVINNQDQLMESCRINSLRATPVRRWNTGMKNQIVFSWVDSSRRRKHSFFFSIRREKLQWCPDW